MPYKLTDPWNRAVRKYLGETKASICDDAYRNYKYMLAEAGEIIGYPDPSKITLQQLKELESKFAGKSDATISIKCHVTKTFLTDLGNAEARRWKITHVPRPKVNGVFLTEEQIAVCRQAARQLGPLQELTFSLGVDNGLRCIDQQRLTMQNVEELLSLSRTSMILGKGRNGGKPGALVLSKMTVEPLRKFLEIRARTVEKWHLEASQKLFIVEYRDGHGAALLSRVAMRQLNKEVSELAKINFNTHDRRRSYGKRLRVIAKLPIETVAKCLRHESINQAFRAYIGIESDELTEAQDRLNP